MVFKSFHLARQSLAKGFTHGYAQSLVAGVSQNNPLASLHYQERQRKSNSLHGHGFASAALQATGGIKSTPLEHQDSGLAAYYAALQKQKVDGNEWSQFQFRKRIEWKPSVVSKKDPDVFATQDAHSTADDFADLLPVRSGLSRAYSTSQVDDLKKVVVDAKAEKVALAQVNQAIAREVAKSKLKVDVVAEDAEVEAEAAVAPVEPSGAEAKASVELDASPAAGTSVEANASLDVDASVPLKEQPSAIEHARPEPSVASDTLVDSDQLSRTNSIAASSHSETDIYAGMLTRLVDERRYTEIPAVFERMLQSGVEPSASSYNTLISAAANTTRAKHQVVPKVLDVYKDMMRRRIAPNTATYSALIELLSIRSLEVVSMKQVLEEKRVRYGGMEEQGSFMLRSNETDFDILRDDGSLSDAVKLFDAATRSQPKRRFSERAYRLLVTACAEGDRIEDMVRIYAHMEAKTVTPCADMFVPMIHAFGNSGDLRSAVECYDEYKALAVANDRGEVSLARKDNDVYASLIKAYSICGRVEGGQKFLSKIEASFDRPEDAVSVRDIVGLKALIPEWLRRGALLDAHALALEQLSMPARHVAMAAICIRAADRNAIGVATDAFDKLPETMDLSRPAMAMGAMHIRDGNIDAAGAFWRVLELSRITPSFIEPTAMHTIAFIGSGKGEQGLRQARQMFARIRDSQSESNQAKMDVVEHIDEAIEVLGHFMAKRQMVLPAQAGMELVWTMIENGGIVTNTANHVLSGMDASAIAQLRFDDVKVLMQVQSGIILDASEDDAGHAARFAHLLDVIVSTGAPINRRTSGLVEKVLVKLDRPDLQHRWYKYKHSATEPVYPGTPYSAVAVPALPGPVPTASHEDSHDPYAATTDNKGSVAITDVLDKLHGRSAAHLNNALTRLRNMRRAGRHPRYFTYARLIAAAAREDRLDLSHEMLNLAKQDVPLLPQYRIVRYGWVTILDAMVAACLTTGSRDLAARYHQDLAEMGAAPSANTFGLYITTLKESAKTFDEASEAVNIFLRAKAEGVEPSSFLYNALIGKLGKARRIDDCLFYFSEMRSLGIRPTSVTYGTIVNALCRVSDDKFAEELFEEMESMPNYKPRPAPFHSLMQFFLTANRDRTKVLAYYDRMRAQKIAPTAHTYKLLIDTYATIEPVDMKAAEGVLEQIRRSGGVPEAVHYSSLIHAKGCVLHDMVGARDLFDSVLADAQIRPQACLYQALFESMVASHRMEDTEDVLKDMKARGVEMTAYIANSLIHGWASVKKIEKAKAVYESLPPAKREPSTYEAMTRALLAADNGASAAAVVNESLSRGYPSAVAGKIVDLIGGRRAAAHDIAA